MAEAGGKDVRVLVAGAAAWAETFKKAPPPSRAQAEAALDGVDGLDSAVRNVIVAALWAFGYDEFVAAVRRELVKPA